MNGIVFICVVIIAGIIFSRLSGMVGASIFKALEIILEFFKDILIWFKDTFKK